MLPTLLLALLTAEPSKEQMLKLEEGMTTEQITALLGQPDATESGTCGQATKKPWPCRTWRYGWVRVLLQAHGPAWVGNGWR